MPNPLNNILSNIKNRFKASDKPSSDIKTDVKEKIKAKRDATPATFSDIIVENPLLILGLDLPFVVVCAVNLRSAIALSIEMFFIHIVTMICAWFIASRVKIWQRVFITSATSFIMMLVSRTLVLSLIPNIENFVGMYLYLIAVNSLTLIQANFLSPKAELPAVIKNALLNVLAFTVSMSLISIFREFFGNGTIWGVPISPFVKLDGIRAPFFGFILMGFLISILKYINRSLTGEYEFKLRGRYALALTREDIEAANPPEETPEEPEAEEVDNEKIDSEDTSEDPDEISVTLGKELPDYKGDMGIVLSPNKDESKEEDKL